MKKWIVYMAILTAVLTSACSAAGMDISKLERSEYDAAEQCREVTMTPAVSSVASGAETLKLHFTNGSDVEYTFGMEPHLDVEKGGVWYVVPTVEGAVWIEIAYVLPANGEADMELPLQSFYGALQKGHYRIVKPLYSEAGSTFVIAEFTVT